MTSKISMVFVSVLLILGLLAGCVVVSAMDAPAMAARFGLYSQTDPESHTALAHEIVDFLCGRTDALPSFQSHEVQHMRDVKNIFTVLFLVMFLGLVGLVNLIFQRKLGSMKVFLQTLLGAAAVIAAFVIWGLIDFDSLFYVFHLVAFRNDLWLLDPAKDLLIQLMPTPFFMDYARTILAAFGCGLVILAGGAYLLKRRYQR